MTYDVFKTWLTTTTHTDWATCINHIHNFIASETKSDKKQQVRFGSSSHDSMLKQIAAMAKLATDVFSDKMKAEQKTGLASLTSPYNYIIANNPENPLDLNTPAYFGYKMTQWLLSTFEQDTLVIAKRDQNTRQRPNLRARLRHVNCQFYAAGLKSTYTTDVLMEITRRLFICPWQEMFGSNNWPAWLKDYSLSAHFTNVPFTTKSPVNDKQVSVGLNINHKTRFVYHAFWDKLEGSDPTVASKKMARVVTELKLKKPRVTNKKKFVKTLQPPTGKAKEIILSRKPEACASSQPFVFGAAPGPYSWQKL